MKYPRRDIWIADIIRDILDKYEDHRLYLAMNLSFACKLRLGEALVLTWDNVHISEKDILNDKAWIYIDKELTRVSVVAMDALANKDILTKFPTNKKNATTRLVLKKPKMASSEQNTGDFCNRPAKGHCPNAVTSCCLAHLAFQRLFSNHLESLW